MPAPKHGCVGGSADAFNGGWHYRARLRATVTHCSANQALWCQPSGSPVSRRRVGDRPVRDGRNLRVSEANISHGLAVLAEHELTSNDVSRTSLTELSQTRRQSSYDRGIPGRAQRRSTSSPAIHSPYPVPPPDHGHRTPFCRWPEPSRAYRVGYSVRLYLIDGRVDDAAAMSGRQTESVRDLRENIALGVGQ